MKHTEESVSRSTYKTLMRPAKQERKSYRLRAFRGSAHRGLFLYRNELICQAKLAILTAFEEDPDKPSVATKIHSKILATNCTRESAAPAPWRPPSTPILWVLL